MALYKKHTGFSLKEVGRDCGGYDHTTVIHIYKKISDLCEVDADFSNMVQGYEHELFKLNLKHSGSV